jgi:hypothetical protein
MEHRIKIGPMVFQVTKVGALKNSKGERFDGWIYHDTCRICLDENLTDQYERVVLWHEIIHEILTQAGVEDQNEGLIDAMAYGLVGVLQDNPWLAGWMIDLSTLQPQPARQQNSAARKGKKNG